MRWLMLVVVWVVFIVYVILGGVVFHYIEQPTESDTKNKTINEYMDFLSNNTCVSHERLEVFMKSMLQGYDQGVLVTYNKTSLSNWDIGSSIFFAITVVTTIGYGHIAPSTDSGRMFFVFYAFVGIPLCVVALGYLGEKLQMPLKKLQTHAVWKSRLKQGSFLKTFIYVTTGLCLLMLLPAVLFWLVEDWSFGDALYYVVVTLTTVGFGDFVPGRNENHHRVVYKLVVCVWIVFGLAWIALLISEVGDIMKGRMSTIIKQDNISNTEPTDIDKEDNVEFHSPSAVKL